MTTSRLTLSHKYQSTKSSLHHYPTSPFPPNQSRQPSRQDANLLAPPPPHRSLGRRRIGLQKRNRGATCACAQLAAVYGDLVLYRNATNYSIENLDFWDVRSADLKTQCVFLPNNADEVAAGVSIIVGCGSQFAIRGGGHMNCGDGVMLALGGLTHMQLAADNATIEVGPGNRLVDVYAALAPYGLYTIGGRLKTISVPGLTLIGAFHYFNNKYGMTMDNIASYDVVLGNGTQVVANRTSNPDLFWALKGGSNNFGIVTKFTFMTYPIPLVSTTIQSFAEVQIEDFITATCNLANNDGPDIAAGSVITISYNLTTKTTAASLLGVQEGTESPPSRFANFSAIASTSKRDAVMAPLAWHSVLESPFQMFRQWNLMQRKLFKIYKGWKAAVETVSDVEGLYPMFNQKLGIASEFIYMGDAGEYQDPFAGFPIASVQRMRSVRAAYDPLGVFTRLDRGGFKLGA
ncbi:hypothetical protein DL95DRAFT_430208 [Leptodontidium sp. 2 PMI_412]|nr:hypothetical protein DL95DRAFT_430208 [Leptodontidium sp. 2 PMI_412]